MTAANTGRRGMLAWEDRMMLYRHLADPRAATILELATGSGDEITIETVANTELHFYGNDTIQGRRKAVHGCLSYVTVGQEPRRMAFAAYDCANVKLVIKIIDTDWRKVEVLEYADLSTCHERP